MEANQNEHIDDVIHGMISLSPLVKNIIATPLFQRLKEVKQLGCVYMCFPEAAHTRYDHCIGTYFLAGRMLASLSKNLFIDEFFKTCVCIAGLLHDVGHGPFSHYWEDVCKELGCRYEHEENSITAVDFIFRNLRLSENNDKHELGVQLIKAFIKGDKKMSPIEQKYDFLFEIICNKQCGIDVDKWDYLLRDNYHAKKYLTKVDLNLNFNEVFENARVSKDNSHIEFHRENFNEIYNLFDARSKLHINLYQAPNVKIREKLLLNAIKEFYNNGYKYKGLDLLKISSKTKDFLLLTDDELLKSLKETNNKEIDYWLRILENNYFEEKQPDTPIIPVEIEIENGGEKMREESIPFYGHSSKENNIKPIKGYYKKKHYFELNNCV